jgi:hypothetical protein
MLESCSSAALLEPYPPQPSYGSTAASLVTLQMGVERLDEREW